MEAFPYPPPGDAPSRGYRLPRGIYIECETSLHSRVNEKFAQFCVTVKKRTEVVSPPSPQIVTTMKDSELGGKGGAGTPLDLRHIREKVG
ncbi:hypothetical protein TNCV_4535871 [Trichonephila clavipes]|nr:hypothetical protein TNCV_4535871 [Trichonephila clavipes]